MPGRTYRPGAGCGAPCLDRGQPPCSLLPWVKLLGAPRGAWRGPTAASERLQSGLEPQHLPGTTAEQGRRPGSPTLCQAPCAALTAPWPARVPHGDTAGHPPFCRGWPCLQCGPRQQPAPHWVSRGPHAGGAGPGLPLLSPLSASCRPGGIQKGVTVLFLYVPLCNKRPEPCSLSMSVSLPAGRSPHSPVGVC